MTGLKKTGWLWGFFLISVSYYNIDNCEKNPGTYQTVAYEAFFTKNDSGDDEWKGNKCPSGRAGFHLLSPGHKHDYQYCQDTNGNQDICI